MSFWRVSYHFIKSIVIVNKEQISPPILFAIFGMLIDDQIPLWTGTSYGQYVRTKEYQCTECRNNAHESANVLLKQSWRLFPLQSADD